MVLQLKIIFNSVHLINVINDFYDEKSRMLRLGLPLLVVLVTNGHVTDLKPVRDARVEWHI